MKVIGADAGIARQQRFSHLQPPAPILGTMGMNRVPLAKRRETDTVRALNLGARQFRKIAEEFLLEELWEASTAHQLA